MGSDGASDTSRDVLEYQFSLLRRMSELERAERMTALTVAVQQLAFAGLREKYPDATDDEIWLRLAARRLGRDVVKRVYGFDAGEP